MARVRLRQASHRARLLPSFIIIGAQRAGTSSLYRHFAEQNGIVKPLRKEIDYFSAHYGRPQSWYRAHFPVRRPGIRTFEATPQYLVHPLAPERLSAMLPDVRLVVILREPIGRLRSQHAHIRGFGLEDLPLAAALEAEEGRTAEDLRLVGRERSHNPRHLFRHGYLARSLYGIQLERWMAIFGREQIHVSFFEDLASEPGVELKRIHEFLDLPHAKTHRFRNSSSRTTSKDESPVPAFALRALAEDRDRLCQLLGRQPPWQLESFD